MRVRGTEVGRCPGSRGLLDADGGTGVKKPELEPTCTVYNINPGKNRKLLSECPVLGQYMLFVGHMREYLGKDSGFVKQPCPRMKSILTQRHNIWYTVLVEGSI